MFTEEELSILETQTIDKSKEYLEKGELIMAESLLRQARRVFPDNEKMLDLLGLTYIKKNKFEDALSICKQLIELNPENYDTIQNLAYCYNAVGEYEKAKQILEDGIEKFPDKPNLYRNLAVLYKNTKEYEKAVEIYEKTIEKFPEDDSVIFNYGIFLVENQKYEEALEKYNKAIKLNPENYDCIWNKSMLNLLMGNYKDGFKDYDCRFKVIKDFQKTKERFEEPEWDGKPGKGTILFYNEQGLGDVFQFIRFLPLVKEKGFNTVVEVPNFFVDILHNCEGVDKTILWRSKERPKCNYVASLSSLPTLLGISSTEQVSLCKFPYVKPTGTLDDENFKDYKDLVKIGICWAGSPYHARDKERSVYLKEFSKINELTGVKLFSLQKDINRRYHSGSGVIDLTEGAEDMSVVDMSSLLHDLNYTASIIEKMDLIITVDTVIAHLAGALNKECWVLVPSLPDWRWGKEGEKTFWYPSVKVFRKGINEEWSEVFGRVEQEIRTKYNIG